MIDNNCELLVKMVFPCRNEKCERSFSTISNRNKHERGKNHGPQSEDKIEIPFFNDAFHCPIVGCDTKSNNKHNILKHLKKCTDLKMERSIVANNKVCPICSKKLLLRNQIATDTSKISTANKIRQMVLIMYLMNLTMMKTNRSSKTKPCRQWSSLLKRSNQKFRNVSQRYKSRRGRTIRVN